MKDSPPAGIAFWIVFPGIAVLEVANPHWYYGFQRGDWINLGVAVGTLALAGITAWNVAVTRDVISAEDRRHQQSLAPIVNAWPHLTKQKGWVLEFVNMGPGPALNIELRYVVVYTARGRRQRHEARMRRNVLAANGGNFQSARLEVPGDAEAPVSIETVSNIELRYRDMFGNQYESDRTPDSFDWRPPSNLW